MDDYGYLRGLGELEIIKNRALELSPLVSAMENSYAAVSSFERHGFFKPEQYNLKRAENVNMAVHNQWAVEQIDNPWQLVNGCYTHLIDQVTQMYLELHPADRWAGGLPSPANTKAARARYRQSECLASEEIHWNMSPNGDGLLPDLSHVHLQAVWKYSGGCIRITLYKPTDVGKRKSCIEIPLCRNRDEQSKVQYEAAAENDILLPGLIDEERDHSEDVGENTRNKRLDENLFD